MSRVGTRLAPAALLVVLSACGSADDASAPAMSTATGGTSSADAEQRFPDVVDATLTLEGDGTFSLDVTMSSPYDSPQRYADGWRVLAPDGTELGAHTLAHDHASEQPFTRTQSGLEIPDGIDTVTVEGRDQVSGYGGETRAVDVPRP